MNQTHNRRLNKRRREQELKQQMNHKVTKEINIEIIVYAIILMVVPIIAALPQFQRSNTNYDSPSSSATILRHDNNNIGIGNYEFAYQTSDGISREEKAELKTIGSNKAVVVRGSYSYVGSDGQTYTVNYVADENGFVAYGPHIHKA
ncbi:hypothetical protein FQR65_LT01141 [Abscondita terminalis]|nr:hypothetical protein FQR65_LT01141 [Abscondita terminalis]